MSRLFPLPSTRPGSANDSKPLSPSGPPARAARTAAFALAGLCHAGLALAAACPSEGFDSVTAPALPAGWSVVNESMPVDAYPDFRFRTVTDEVDSAPNAVFIPDFRPTPSTPAVGSVNDVSLVSPEFTPLAGTVLRFDNRYNFRLSNYTSSTPTRYDGGVLEISINGGPYVDIVVAGGGFASGGYYVGNNDTISTATYGGVGSPIAGRRAWSGMSTSNGVVGTGGVFDSVQTIVDLPAEAIGQPTRVRFRSVVGAATSTTPTSFPLPPSGTPGWWIDSLDCDTPPRLAKQISPSNTPVGTPTRMTLSLQHTAGGATLTADLVNTLPAGMQISTPSNAVTTCGAATLTADAASSSFTLGAGATIPAGGCSIGVDLVATAAGIYEHVLVVGQLQTDLGDSPNAGAIRYQATQDGVATYVTSFEAGTGSPTVYPTGADTASANLSGKDGWVTNAGSGVLNNVRVQVANPDSGDQHVRIRPATPNGNGYQSVRAKQFLAGTTDYAIAAASVAIQPDATTPTPAPFDFAPLYVEAGTDAVRTITRVRFAGAFTDPPFHATNPIVGLDPSILVEDAASGGFVDTHVDWTGSANYSDLRVVSRRADAAILVCLDGNPIYIGQGASPDLRSLQFSLQRQNLVSTNTYDIDDVLIDNRNEGGCADAPGPVAPVVRKAFSVPTIEIDTPFTSTLTVHNWNASPITLDADFTDSLPVQLEVLGASTTCSGGTGASFSAGGVTLGSGATVPAEGSCTITTTLRGVATGEAVDDIAIGDLSTDAGDNATGPAATVSVTEVLLPPTLSTSFAPPSIAAGSQSTLRVTLMNPNFSALVLNADLVNALPAGLSIGASSTTCSGVASHTTDTLRLGSGATIPGNGGSCILQGTVSAVAAGSYVNTLPAGALQTSGGDSLAAASDTLTVTSATPSSVSFQRTVGTDLSAGACGSDKVLTVTARTAVNFCYRLTNNTDRTLRFHSLNSGNYGRLAHYAEAVIAPGATHQINDIRVVVRDVVDTATWNADDALVNYAIEMNPAGLAWEDISGTGAIHTNTSSSTVIPFPFTFYGEPQTFLDMVDGGLGFGRGTLGLNFVNSDLPSASEDMVRTILPLWDRWSSLAGGTMYWQVKGVAPERRLITQWQNRKFNANNPLGIRYQAVLFEKTGEIAFVYDQVDNGITDPANGQFQHAFGKSATIGLNFDDSRAAKVSFFGEDAAASATPVINNGDTIRFTPSDLVRFSATDTVGVMVVSAQVAVDTSAIAVPVKQGTTETRSLSIGNSGSANLTWELDPARTAGSHLPPAASAWPDREALGVAPDSGAGLAARSAAGSGASVPAFAYTLSASSRSLVSLDVEAPMLLSTIDRYPVSEPEFDITGMDFIGADFSTLYGVSYGSDSASVNGVLHAFDVETGVATRIGTTQANVSGKNEARSDFAYDPVDEKLYLISFYTVPHTLNLYTVDPATAQTQFVTRLTGPGATGIVNAIGINGQGQMFGIDISNDRLIAIDKRSGETAIVGPLGYNATSDQSLDFDERTDTLYWIGGAGPSAQNAIYSVFRIDTETGAATLVDGTGYFGSSPSEIGTSAFAIATSHPCSLPGDVDWLQISETSGVVGPADTDRVELTFRPQGLADGLYSALLCLASNDPVTPRLRVPVSMTVATGNLPPVALTANVMRSIASGQALNMDFSLLFDDPDGEALAYSMTGAPAGLAMNAQTGVLSGTLGADAAVGSPYTITIRARDAENAEASLTFQLVVLGSFFYDGFD